VAKRKMAAILDLKVRTASGLALLDAVVPYSALPSVRRRVALS